VVSDDRTPRWADGSAWVRPEDFDTAERSNPRSAVLADADQLVNGDRNAAYGPPTQDFARTAAMWSAYLGIEVQAHDVAALMVMLKVSRISWSPERRDSWVDLAGYAACGWDCAKDIEGAPDAD